jgi:hypothetical protein
MQDWLKEQEAIMEKNGEENIDLHIERLTIATVSCVRYSLQKKWRQKRFMLFSCKLGTSTPKNKQMGGRDQA